MSLQNLQNAILSYLSPLTGSKDTQQARQRVQDNLQALVDRAYAVHKDMALQEQSSYQLQRANELMGTVEDANRYLTGRRSWRTRVSRTDSLNRQLRARIQELESVVMELESLLNSQPDPPSGTGPLAALEDPRAEIPEVDQFEPERGGSAPGSSDPLPGDVTEWIEPSVLIRITNGTSSAEVWRGNCYRGGDRAAPLQVVLKCSQTYITKRRAHRQQGMDRQILRLIELQHSNLLPFLGTALISRDLDRFICFVSPWMDNGNVTQYLKRYPEANRVFLTQGILQGLNYLHSQQPPIAHGRLKGTNVLIAASGIPRITDYGLAIPGDDSTGFSISADPEWVRWVAPEYFLPGQFNLTGEEAWGPPADIFSLGMTIYEVLFDRVPFTERTSSQAQEDIQAGSRPEIADQPSSLHGHAMLVDLMNECWVQDPRKRPRSQQLMARLRSETQPATIGLFHAPLDYTQYGGHAQKACDRCRKLRKRCLPGTVEEVCKWCEMRGVYV
ncbi:kinase-like protein [Calocera cornea HHB12733]|uniref:Kinase-like protein n=1 Tax=Calocera cornea HHB12733 TaxID=1353952 RepID=A0A165G283_9BASI|nr:kinase-like protein [Calocera cornea HHB12733]